MRGALTTMGLPDDFVADAVLCVSELSTNAITHAPGAHGELSVPPVAPELWVYRRGQEGRPQLVVAVFDALRRWRGRGTAERDDLFAEGGRGLDIVRTLAVGRSGWHLTRSRLGGPRVSGKACWFALPISVPDPRPFAAPSPRPTEAQAAGALAALLADRGIDQGIHHYGARQSVVSARRGLTVWCRGGGFWWISRDGTQRRPFSDIVEVGERVVQLHEETAAAADAPPRRTAVV